MTYDNDIFRNYTRKNLPVANNCWSCFNAVLLRSSFGVPLVLLWLSYGTFSLGQMSNGSLHTLPLRENVGAKKPTLKWIRSAFEEGSKIMRRYLTDISSSAHEAGLVTPRSGEGRIKEKLK